MDPIKWIIGMFILLGIMWYAAGGGEVRQRPFIEAPSPLDGGEQYGPGERESVSSYRARRAQEEVAAETPVQSENTTNATPSLFAAGVSIDTTYGADAISPSDEYITITASPNTLQPINITGWRLKSAVTGNEASIGAGTYLPYSGRVNTQEAIFLRPGETAIITTGRSPFGVSFRLNQCTGYLEAFQDFVPPLSRSCPLVADGHLPSGGARLSDACLDYLDTIRSCSVPLNVPASLPSSCHEFVAQNATYNGCVEARKADASFALPEWRIFLGRSAELWKERRETIQLIDAEGRVVDTVSY